MIGKIIAGQYELVEKLGEGGMGHLYLANDTNLKVRRAIKTLLPALTPRPEFRERFRQEAEHQATLRHPNIVQAIALLEEHDVFFFVMEYIDGQDLGKIIKTQGRLPEQQTLSIIKNILEGLRYAHNNNIIHRDIKPSNILIDPSGLARITDFGIAIAHGERRLTATGRLLGSPWYMSPEQIKHPQSIDRRSDIYSAGIVLYEMLTGDVPYDGDTEFNVQEKQVGAPVPDPCQRCSKISRALGQVVVTALAKQPGDRFQNCTEFLAALEATEKTVFTDHSGPHPITISGGERTVDSDHRGQPCPPKTRSRLAILTSALLITTVIGLIGLGLIAGQYVAQQKDNSPSSGPENSIVTVQPPPQVGGEQDGRPVALAHPLTAPGALPPEAKEQSISTPGTSDVTDTAIILEAAKALIKARTNIELPATNQKPYQPPEPPQPALRQEPYQPLQPRNEPHRLPDRQNVVDFIRSYYQQDMPQHNCNAASQKWAFIRNMAKFCDKINRTESTIVDSVTIGRYDNHSATVYVELRIKPYSRPLERWGGAIELTQTEAGFKIRSMSNLRRLPAEKILQVTADKVDRVLLPPSFDCTKASTNIENLICNSRLLSDADGRLGKIYYSLLHSLPKTKADQLMENQRNWIRQRDNQLQQNCMTASQVNERCALSLMEKRIGELRYR